jgi:hypothetical protein
MMLPLSSRLGEGVVRITRAAVVGVAVAGVVAAVAYAALPLTGRVLRSGELAGMKPNVPAHVVVGANAWVGSGGFAPLAPKAEIARLRKLGFVAGVNENVSTPGNQNRYGLSAVQQFSSAKSAAAELVFVSTSEPRTSFPVHGIPGALGFESISNQNGARNVAFADGDYYDIVGAGWGGGSSNAVSRSTLTAAAVVLYHRVHGR